MHYYVNYSPIGDYCSLTILILFFLIFKSSLYSYAEKNKSLKIGLYSLFFATLSNVLFMFFVNTLSIKYVWLVYIFRSLANSLLTWCLFVFSKYLTEMFEKNKKLAKHRAVYNNLLGTFFTILIFIAPYLHIGFYIDSQGLTHGSFMKDPFVPAYIVGMIGVFFQLYRYRKYILKKAYYVLIGLFFICETIMILESIGNSTSLVCFTYVMCVFVVFVLFHSNSYDLQTGTLNKEALNEFIESSYKKQNKFIIISLLFLENKDLDGLLERINEQLNHFYDKYLIGAYTFRISDRRFVLVCRGIKGSQSDKQKVLKEFENKVGRLKTVHNMNYKLVACESTPLLKNYYEYLNFWKYMEKKIEVIDFNIVQEKALSDYFYNLSIKKVLEDIVSKKDLNDPRILVYTQPIFDTNSKTIKSAESLMRLEVNNKIIYPDDFIPLAEENDYIHTLSLIILNKVCKNIFEINKKYELDRISVNFSTKELNLATFSTEVKKIIKKNKIPFNSIGIEVTESQVIDGNTDSISKLKDLSKVGMKLYLDDFGTGYSNFERIMQIPFDIIKFDKSLLNNSNENKKFDFMTKNLCKTYKDLGYKILFEGAETEKDTKKCKDDFYCDYIQGYYYSKPVPIEKLNEFLEEKKSK